MPNIISIDLTEPYLPRYVRIGIEEKLVRWKFRCVTSNPNMPERFELYKPKGGGFEHILSIDAGVGLMNTPAETSAIFSVTNDELFITKRYFVDNTWAFAPIEPNSYNSSLQDPQHTRDWCYVNWNRPNSSSFILQPDI